MTVNDVFGMFEQGKVAVAICVFIMTIVQIAPIKVNPWSWLAKKFGQAINGEIVKKIDSLEKDIASIKHDNGEDRAINARIRILRFNDELLTNQRHSKESFDQTLDDITYYERYCEKHPDFLNNRTKMAVSNIERCYQKCQVEHDFL